MESAETCPFDVNFLSFRAYDDKIDNPSNFLCENFVTKLGDLPHSKKIPTPWSANYWPIRKGGLSYRYSPKFPAPKKISWEGYVTSYSQPQDHNQHYETKNFTDFVNQYYSPAEKYDLLVGDYNYTLTNAMKKEGENWAKGHGNDVPGWFGKCHGWVPAAINELRPVHTVEMTAADGKTVIAFYPEDVRALATAFWANAQYETKWVGHRCDMYESLDEVPSDKETGLWEDYRCFTVNPATLVTILGNHLGIKGKSLVYDPDSNGEIWNQPVYGYDMTFFNAQTGEEGTLSRSIIGYGDLTKDAHHPLSTKFLKKKKAPNAENIVGVNMTVYFVFENPPHFPESKTDETIKDNTDSRTYIFYLELDKNDNIVGGEWTENEHPIFMWNPAEGATINGLGDDLLKTFNGSVKELKEISKFVTTVSEKNSVLKAVMKYLVSKSSSEHERLAFLQE